MADENLSNPKSPEMTPQEDGTKVPLTSEDLNNAVEGAKFVANPNGDAKIDVEIAPTFSGMTKEELMKYSNDPFWVRLRWFLFILFWIGWLVMLIMAIVIIVQAPGCKPPPELLWVEEQSMIEVNKINLPDKEALLNACKNMGIPSVYFPGLMKNENFKELDYDAQPLIDAIIAAEKEIVTDFPSFIESNNPFYQNASDQNLIESDGTWNYTNENLPSVLYKEIVEWWMSQGVKGFLMKDSNTVLKRHFKNKLNGFAMGQGGAVGSNVINIKNEIKSPSSFKEFLESQIYENFEDQLDNWNFYKFNPRTAEGGSVSSEDLRLITIGLFLSPGTPIVHDVVEGATNTTRELIRQLNELKAFNGIKFGSTQFANTTDNVVAFTRVYKGTPAYAVALNFNNVNETVSFMNTSNVGDTGTVELYSQASANFYGTKEKHNMDEVIIGPQEGIVLQFVANFN